MAICPECGHQVPDDDRFCGNCGAPMSDATGTINLVTAATEDEPEALVDAATLEALAPGTALLVVQRGPNSGSRFLLDADVVTVGRRPDCTVFLDDITVSRHHAEFRRGESTYEIADSGSLNGTYVNRERIDRLELAGGDEVQIGRFRLLYFPAASGVGGEGA
jgi:pSer/pThr/pTyr-binding forkhead associated (FHA) protein